MKYIKTFEKYSNELNESWKNTLSAILLGLSTFLSNPSKSMTYYLPGKPGFIWQTTDIKTQQNSKNNDDGDVYEDRTDEYLKSYKDSLINEINKINIDDTLYQKIKIEVNKEKIDTKLVTQYLKQAIGEKEYNDLDSIFNTIGTHNSNLKPDKQSLLNCIGDLWEISYYQSNKDENKYFLIIAITILCICFIPLGIYTAKIRD